MDAMEAMRVCLGPGVLLSYVLQGLFHPAHNVREVRIFSYSFCITGSHLLADRSIGMSITCCTWVLRMLSRPESLYPHDGPCMYVTTFSTIQR